MERIGVFFRRRESEPFSGTDFNFKIEFSLHLGTLGLGQWPKCLLLTNKLVLNVSDHQSMTKVSGSMSLGEEPPGSIIRFEMTITITLRVLSCTRVIRSRLTNR